MSKQKSRIGSSCINFYRSRAQKCCSTPLTFSDHEAKPDLRTWRVEDLRVGHVVDEVVARIVGTFCVDSVHYFTQIGQPQSVQQVLHEEAHLLTPTLPPEDCRLAKADFGPIRARAPLHSCFNNNNIRRWCMSGVSAARRLRTERKNTGRLRLQVNRFHCGRLNCL